MDASLAALAAIDGVPSSIAAANAAVEVVHRDRGLRRVGEAQRGAALALGAQASADLTGEPDRWLAGALRVAAELTSLARLIRVAPGQALAQAHLLAARGVEPTESLGRLSDPVRSAPRMSDLARLLTGNGDAPAILVGALVHAEVATLAPFGGASGLLGRAAERAVLVAAGLDPQGVIPVEAGHAAAGRPAYEAALQGYARGTVLGVGGWIRWCAAAVARAAELTPARRI